MGRAAPAASRMTAGSLPAEVSAFRQSMTTQLDAYFRQYGDRLSAAERQQMNALRDQVDRDLLMLKVKTQTTSRLASARAPQVKRIAAAQAAARAFDAVYEKAMHGLEQVQPILQPKLSIFEALRAKSDLDDQLEKFDELGRHVHELAGAQDH